MTGETGDKIRNERLRAALRENLKRRKAQARGRAEAGKPAESPHYSAGIDRDIAPSKSKR